MTRGKEIEPPTLQLVDTSVYLLRRNNSEQQTFSEILSFFTQGIPSLSHPPKRDKPIKVSFQIKSIL